MRVTAGILERDGRVLIARRKPGRHMGRKWEFPGGKIEAGETPQESLARELEEELGVRATIGEFLCRASYQGEGITLELLVYRVRDFDGTLTIRDHDELRWVLPGELRDFELADSDRSVVERLF